MFEALFVVWQVLAVFVLPFLLLVLYDSLKRQLGRVPQFLIWSLAALPVTFVVSGIVAQVAGVRLSLAVPVVLIVAIGEVLATSVWLASRGLGLRPLINSMLGLTLVMLGLFVLVDGGTRAAGIANELDHRLEGPENVIERETLILDERPVVESLSNLGLALVVAGLVGLGVAATDAGSRLYGRWQVQVSS